MSKSETEKGHAANVAQGGRNLTTDIIPKRGRVSSPITVSLDANAVEEIALLAEVQLLRAAGSDVERAAVRQYVVHLLRAISKFGGGAQ